MIDPLQMDISVIFDRLEIKCDGEARFDDGTCVFQITNLEEEKRDLLENIGLDCLGYDLFYSESEKVDLNKKLPHLEPFYINEEQYKWLELTKNVTQLDFCCAKMGKKCPFEPSIKHIEIVTVWNGKIVKNESEFSKFIGDLYNLIYEGLKDNLESKYKRHDFWESLKEIRHFYAHDSTKWRDKDKIKNAQKVSKFFQSVIESDGPSIPLDFINCQLEILESCNEFLDDIAGGLSE